MPDHPPSDLEYQTALREEQQQLATVTVPIVTVSATTRSYLETLYGDVFPDTPEVVFSRAHYSMALGCLIEAFRENLTAWLVDPTNYVSSTDWPRVMFTETVGKLVARHELLKDLKNIVENKTRSKLPISEAIEKPLLSLFERVTKPILSLHYEAGNKLIKTGKTVVQVVTDPHVRPQYLDPLPLSTEHVGAYYNTPLPQTQSKIIFCVFDASTKSDLLNQAKALGKLISPDQVIVTGPPVDPRIVAAGNSKKGAGIQEFARAAGRRRYGRQSSTQNSDSEPLRLAIITGGIGTNFGEIKTLLSQLKTDDFTGNHPLQLLLYAGLHQDFLKLYQNFAHRLGVNVGDLANESAPIRIIHENSLVEANEHLINYVFPWADAIITKPSGDMAYDAAAAAIPCLFLDPLGPWEENIQARFLALRIGHDLDINQWQQELTHLLQPQSNYPDFFTAACSRCLSLPDHYTKGCENILKVTASLG